MIAIGIDTGSTSTDAVIYDIDQKKVLDFAKSITTHENLEIGIRQSLKKLSRDLIGQSSYLSLSTTLATNACVENKGADICLLFIGASRKAVDWTLSSYGFESMDFMRFIDGDPSRDILPDWKSLDEMLPEIISHYDGIAIAQIGARENDGLYEHEAAGRIHRYEENFPVTCSYDIFRELNVIKRGAGALLNARIAPEINAFFNAIHQVLNEENIDLPIFIMRSDGSLVSESYTLQYPVETLVCGPTASAKGAVELFNEQQAIVVDMGGTTSDMALIKNGQPKLDDEGIRLSGWQTFVKGVSIETIGLGGDSHIKYKKGQIMLDSRRVMPVSVLAASHPEILPELERINENPNGSFVHMHEHFMLMHTIQDPDNNAVTENTGNLQLRSNNIHRWSEKDLSICEALAERPLSICQLADALNTDSYHLETDNLEQLGIILRCGFTPTDAILLKGDRSDSSCGAYGDMMGDENAYKGALLALQFIASSSGLDKDYILEETYRQIKEKLFCQLVSMLWRDARPFGIKRKAPDELNAMAKEAFALAMSPEGTHFYRNIFKTDAVLLGTGAPTHIFISDIAKALHTTWKSSEYSSVSNALGAVLGNVCVYDTVNIKIDYVNPKADKGTGNYIVYGTIREAFEEMDDAIELAARIATEKARRQAINCGAREITSLDFEVHYKTGSTKFGLVQMGADVIACARGKLI